LAAAVGRNYSAVKWSTLQKQSKTATCYSQLLTDFGANKSRATRLLNSTRFFRKVFFVLLFELCDGFRGIFLLVCLKA